MQQLLMQPRFHRMIAVREAFRLRHLARRQRRLCDFYLEHCQLEQARDARQRVLDSLRRACHQWRLTLGTAL